MDMKENLVYKSNDIIQASYALTVKEQRLLLACISQIKSDVELAENNSFTLTVDEARDLFYTNKDRYNAYRDLVLATEKLFDRKIIMQSEDGKKEMLTRWVSTVKFDHEEMTATLYFHDEIKPYISQLKSNFTKYRLKHIAELSSVYAIRIYEMIVSWHGQNKSFVEITVDDFRVALDLGRKYKQFGELRKFVIEKAVEQINERTNYELEIQAKKRGRSYHKLQFRFNQKTEDVDAEQERFEQNLEKRRQGKQKRLEQELKDQKQKEWSTQKRTKAEFLAFCEGCKISVGMKFKSVTLEKTYEIEEGILVNSSDFKGKFGLNGQTYFLDEEKIKQLIFIGEFKQITNEEDTQTADIFDNQ